MSICILVLLLLINLKDYKSMLLRGKRAYDGQFPWLIQFQTIAPCGGVLLSSDWVLTAAQCVQDKRNSIILFATGLNGTGSAQTVSVKATYIYPQYEAYSVLPDRDSNIALLKLVEPFAICNTKIIAPNIVPVSYDDNYKSCLIFGWQSYVSPTSKVFAKPIQYSEVILNSWKLCTYMIKTNGSYTNLFCAMVEFKNEVKPCAGNPGSPVICENKYDQTVLLGIASWTNFSLECGDLLTYLDLDTFSIWIYNIIFNDKEKREWEANNKSNEKHFKFKDNIGTYDNSQNDSGLLQINYWHNDTKKLLQNISTPAERYRVTPQENMNTSHFWNKLYLPVFNDFSDTNVSISHSHHEIPYTNIVKESSNSIYRYKEIGNIRSSEDQNQIVENFDTHEQQFQNLNKCLLCKNEKFDKITMEHRKNQVELDDFEYLLPFTFEDITTSYSNITTMYSKILYFFYLILWYVFYIIYM